MELAHPVSRSFLQSSVSSNFNSPRPHKDAGVIGKAKNTTNMSNSESDWVKALTLNKIIYEASGQIFDLETRGGRNQIG